VNTGDTNLIQFNNDLEFVEINITDSVVAFAGSVVSDAPLKVTGSTAKVTLGDGGSLNIRNGAANALNVELPTPGSTLEFNRSAGHDYTYSGVVSGSGSLAKSGNGKVTLTANQPYTGPTLVSGGTLVVNGTLTGGTYAAAITFSNDGNLELNQADDQVLSGTLSGPGNLVKSGAGKLTLTGTNSYKNTTVTGGTLAISDDNNLGTAGTGTNTLNGGTLSLAPNTYSKPWVLGGNGGTIEANGTTRISAFSGTGSLTKTGAGRLELAGNHIYTGNTTLSAGSLQIIGLLGNGNYPGDIINNVSGNSLEFAQTREQIIRGAISGAGGLSKSNTGDLIFAGNNTYTGDTAISGGRLEVTGRLGNGNYAGAIQVGSGATIEFNQNTNQILTGGLTGGGNLVKRGNGTLTLTMANSALNTVTVAGGGFRVNNTLQATSVTVTGGILGGNGVISTASPLTVAAGAGIAPGNGNVGTLTVAGGNVEFAAGAKFYVEIRGNEDTDYDLLVVNNEVHLGGASLDLTVFLSSTFEPDPTKIYTIIQADKIEGQFSSGNRAWAPATAWAFDILYNENSVQLVNGRPVVPEPSTYALFAAAGALALAAVRRRRKAGIKN
jgi:autotransporter-associated beta strand protein